MNPRAMILAAGLGTRMRPLTDTRPKPLITLAGAPLIDWCLELLHSGGVREVVVNASYRAAQLEAHLATISTPRIHCSREDFPPLETGGGVRQALPLLGAAPFVTMNADAIFARYLTHPLQALQQAWHDQLDFLMLLVARPRAIGWHGAGDFIRREDGSIRRPQQGEDAPYLFSGMQMMHPRVFEGAPAGAFSLSQLWRLRESQQGWHRAIGSVVYDGDWLNVGDLEGLEAAEAYAATHGLSIGRLT